MATTKSNQDISVRGGQVNVPTPTEHRFPPRHQPNTPVRKQRTKPAAIPDPPQPPAAEPPVLPETEPETVSEE